MTRPGWHAFAAPTPPDRFPPPQGRESMARARRVSPDLQLLDLDLPAGKPAGQLSIQAAAAQDQAYLIGLDDDHGSVLRRMQDDSLNGRGLQRIGDQPLGRVIPTEEVDALPAEHIHNVLDVVATDADTSANAIHPG